MQVKGAVGQRAGLHLAGLQRGEGLCHAVVGEVDHVERGPGLHLDHQAFEHLELEVVQPADARRAEAQAVGPFVRQLRQFGQVLA